jgi:hypothetical protein
MDYIPPFYTLINRDFRRETHAKLIVAGSRNIKEYSISCTCIKAWIDMNEGFLTLKEIVSGAAEGPDTHGIYYAEATNIAYRTFRPQWDKFGKKAGILRNIDMGNYADELLVIYDGKSRGTAHMIKYMTDLKKPVTIFEVPLRYGKKELLYG